MRDDRPSFTARWVATMRGLGAFLPDALRLIDDPYGLRFAGKLRALRDRPAIERSARAMSRLWLRPGLRRSIVYWQLRSRIVDDAIATFVRAGGRQIVLLGAGFDCRAWRLGALAESTVFEVDHGPTQAEKRAVMAGEAPAARSVLVPWDFERRPLRELAPELAARGHDRSAPTMTILEGVCMFLSPDALDATFEGMTRYSAPGSPVAMTYMSPAIFADRSLGFVRRRAVVRLMGEPFRSCFEPRVLAPWLAARGFALESNESAMQAGTRLLGADQALAILGPQRSTSHVALAHAAAHGVSHIVPVLIPDA
jgi:methyltransferase (TIGR00027 family)